MTTIAIKAPSFLRKIVSGSLLVAGTSVGAGMLGIPSVTITSGFFPGLTASFLVWGFMLVTGLLLLEISLRMPKGANILSITETYLGKPGRYFAGATFLFLYYCLLVAYIAGGGPLVASFALEGLSFSLQCTLFTALIGVTVYLGVQFVDRVNIFMSLLMLIFFGLMFLGGSSAVESTRLFSPAKYTHLFLAVPVLFGAFGYHNVVPTLCDYLQRDKKALRLSLVFGTVLAMSLYSLWQYLIIGSIDSSILEQTVLEGKTVISALERATSNPSLYIFGKWFGALALITSVLGVSLSVVDFFKDGLRVFGKNTGRLLPSLLTFLPPLCFTLGNPCIFTTALGIAGGIGEALINGILPVVLFWIYAKNKTYLYKSFLTFLFVLGLGTMIIEVFDLMK